MSIDPTSAGVTGRAAQADTGWVEAATRALLAAELPACDSLGAWTRDPECDDCVVAARETVRTVLAAVAPDIAARSWDRCVDRATSVRPMTGPEMAALYAANPHHPEPSDG